MRGMVAILWILALAPGFLAGETKGEETMSAPTVLPGVTLKVVYNNYPGKEGLTTDWGLACVIEGAEKPILFDTGTNGRVLLDNMERMGISADAISVVAFSHVHEDHTGGMPEFLQANPDVTVFVLPSFPADFKKRVASTGARCVDVSPGMPISPGVWSTGELGTSIREQALVAATREGLVVVTGCAHPGVVEMVRGAKEVAEKAGLDADTVALVTGGFHMRQMDDIHIHRTIDELRALGVKRAAPSHCSGDRTRELFREAFGPDYVVGDLGATLTIGRPASP